MPLVSDLWRAPGRLIYRFKQAPGTTASRIVPITPWMEKRADGRYVCIPKDAGFSLSEYRAAAGQS